MKLGEVQSTLEGLYKIATKNLPVKVSYAIAKNIKVLNEEYKTIDEQRIKLCEKYADKDDDGKAVMEKKGEKEFYKFSDGNEVKMNDEYKELLEEEAELDIHTVDITEFEKCDMSDRYDILTPAEYANLEFMIE